MGIRRGLSKIVSPSIEELEEFFTDPENAGDNGARELRLTISPAAYTFECGVLVGRVGYSTPGGPGVHVYIGTKPNLSIDWNESIVFDSMENALNTLKEQLPILADRVEQMDRVQREVDELRDKLFAVA